MSSHSNCKSLSTLPFVALFLLAPSSCTERQLGIEAATPAAAPAAPREPSDLGQALSADEDGFADAYVTAAVDEAASKLARQSTLIASVATDPQVRRLGRKMASDYGSHRRRLDALVTLLGVPAPSPTSGLIELSTESDIAATIAHDPLVRDGLLLSLAIEDQERVLRLIDRLLPTVEHPELRALIEQDLQYALRANLEQARGI